MMTEMDSNPDVVVIGGGPAGSSAAYVLAKSGWDVLVLDKRKEIGKPVQCAEFIHRAGFNAPDDVIAQSIEKMVTHLPDGDIRISDSPGYVIYRDRYDAYLAEKARQAGARFQLSTRGRLLENGNVMLINGYQKQVAPRLCIDASGPKVSSEVARAIQMSIPLEKPLRDIHVWLSHDIPGGYAWLFPKNRVANLGLAITGQRKELNLKRLLKTVYDRIKDEFCLGAEPQSFSSGLIPVTGITSLLRNNVLLAGDACGITHPISGEGIYRARLTGELAGEAAANFLASSNPEDLEAYPEQVMDIFEHANQRDIKKRVAFETITAKHHPIDRETYKQLWIGFSEYYQN